MHQAVGGRGRPLLTRRAARRRPPPPKIAVVLVIAAIAAADAAAADDEEEARHCAYARPRHLSGQYAPAVRRILADGERAGERLRLRRRRALRRVASAALRRRGGANFMRYFRREPARARLCGPSEWGGCDID